MLPSLLCCLCLLILLETFSLLYKEISKQSKRCLVKSTFDSWRGWPHNWLPFLFRCWLCLPCLRSDLTVCPNWLVLHQKTKPNQTKPNQTKPNQTKPSQKESYKENESKADRSGSFKILRISTYIKALCWAVGGGWDWNICIKCLQGKR